MSKNWQNLAVEAVDWDRMGSEEKLITMLAKSFLAPNERLQNEWVQAIAALGLTGTTLSKDEVYKLASERAHQLMAYKASHRITIDLDNLDPEGYLVISRAMALTAPNEEAAKHHVETAKKLGAVVPDADGLRIRLLVLEKATDIVEINEQSMEESASITQAAIGRAKGGRSGKGLNG